MIKSFPAKVRAESEGDGLEDGQFIALVSVFGNKDSYGDIVQPGAFLETLADWEASGNPIPVYYSHQMDNPFSNLGAVLEAKETDQGLWVKVQMDLEDNPTAKQVYKLLKGGRLTQFSFAYDVVDGGWEVKDDDEFYSLRKLRLYEVGPTPIGANQETELIAVKNASEHAAGFASAVASGRLLSLKNATTLRDAHAQLSAAAEQIAEVLTLVESTQDRQEKNAQPEQPAAEDEPVPLAVATPTAAGPADILTHLSIVRRI